VEAKGQLCVGKSKAMETAGRASEWCLAGGCAVACCALRRRRVERVQRVLASRGECGEIRRGVQVHEVPVWFAYAHTLLFS